MGHRLSKIYTRTGDDGTTGLANGERVDKTDARVAAFGDVDETNSALGLLLAEKDLPPPISASITRIQHARGRDLPRRSHGLPARRTQRLGGEQARGVEPRAIALPEQAVGSLIRDGALPGAQRRRPRGSLAALS